MAADMDASVVIPAHDEGHLLTEAVNSVLRQERGGRTFPTIEIIIVPDRVDDATGAEVLALASKFPDIVRVVPNDRLPGVAGARNSGIVAARGEWITFLDGDDIWTDTSLAARWDAIGNHPEIAWVGADFVRWHEAEPRSDIGSLRRNAGTNALLTRAYETGDPTIYQRPAELYLKQILCWTGTVMVKRELLMAVGLFDEALVRAEDVHLWYRLAATTDYLFVPEVLAFYRQRPSTLARRGTSPRGYHNLALRKLLDDPLLVPWRKAVRASLARTLCEEVAHLRQQQQFARAVGTALLSLRYKPVQIVAYRRLVGALLRRE